MAYPCTLNNYRSVDGSLSKQKLIRYTYNKYIYAIMIISEIHKRGTIKMGNMNVFFNYLFLTIKFKKNVP